MADTSSTNLDKMRSAIADIIQKALLSHPTMDTNFVYSKSKILEFHKIDIDEFIKDFILFEKRY